MNANLEKYIKDLSPELQKKARACKSPEEFTQLAAENDIELSEEALEAVSGGGWWLNNPDDQNNTADAPNAERNWIKALNVQLGAKGRKSFSPLKRGYTMNEMLENHTGALLK